MINIEKMTDTGGHEEKEMELVDALVELNIDLENGQTIWIDNKPFMGDMLANDDLEDAKDVCVTNKLTGG